MVRSCSLASAPLCAMAAVSVAIYVNFFAHHFTSDARPLLFLAAAVMFAPCTLHFKVWEQHRRMPLLLGLVLVALFIWFAENIGTFSAAWVYPSQRHGWHMVSIAKLGSWFLLMLISYTLVAAVNGVAHASRHHGSRRPAPLPLAGRGWGWGESKSANPRFTL